MAESLADVVARGYEPAEPRLRPVALGAAAIIATVLIALVAGFIITRDLPHDGTAETDRPPDFLPPTPRLEAVPENDFPAFHAQKARLLHEYAWVDRAHGVVRIPIERAMQVLVERQGAQGKRP